MKRTLAFAVLLFCGLVSLSYSQEGRIVAVTSEKEIEIQNGDVAAARTVALAAAARDAVEKGFGTYIKIEEHPEARTVIAQSAAKLQYKVLAEQQKGNKYWVKIQANVNIPADYVLDSSPAGEREDLGETMGNFVQKYPQGEINWGEGHILAYGKGVITSGGANSEEQAARAAEVDARAHLLEIIHDIPVDDRMKSGEEPRMSFALEGFVQGAEVVTRSRSGTNVNVTVKAPIRGVKGLSMTMYGFYTPPPPEVPEVIKPTVKKQAQKPAQKPPQKPPQTPEETKPEDFTGIVIDARAIPAAPAIFPKIKDTEKRDVYGVNKVNQEDLQKRGMASYAVVAREVNISRLFPKAMVVQVRYSPEETKEQTKTKRRQGYKPLVVKAAGADGKLKANLIVSAEDAQRIVDADEGTNALKECRVVVVVSSEAGGIEGLLLQPQSDGEETAP